MRIISIYHSIRLYLPFVLINLMIIFVFSTYITNYLIGVINNTPYPIASDSLINEAINHHFKVKGFLSRHKLIGINFSITFILSIALMLINLYCTLIFNPGYVNSPIDNEIKLIAPAGSSTENGQLSTANKTQFVNHFERMVSNGPLTYFEFIIMKKQMNKYLNHNRDYNQLETDITEQIDLCSSCLRWKPERAHHCKKCDKCVLKMDHHCPWLSNCIGLYNYKPFLLTLLYGLISSLSVLVTYWEYVLYIIVNDYNSYWHCIWNTFAFVCNLVLFTFLFYLFCTNWRLVFVNMTTIEQAEYQRFSMSTNANKNHKAHSRKFDHGFYANFTDVFGRNPMRWLLPY